MSRHRHVGSSFFFAPRAYCDPGVVGTPTFDEVLHEQKLVALVNQANQEPEGWRVYGYGVGGLAVPLGEDDETLRQEVPNPTNAPMDVRPGGPISRGDFDSQPSHLTLDINDRMPSHDGSADGAGEFYVAPNRGEGDEYALYTLSGIDRDDDATALIERNRERIDHDQPLPHEGAADTGDPALSFPSRGHAGVGRAVEREGDIVGNNPIKDFMPHMEYGDQHWPEGGLWQDDNVTVEKVPVDRIIGGQDHVIDTNFPGAMKGLAKGQLPFVVEQPDGRFLILDGHHRITQQMLNGAQEISARVYHGPVERQSATHGILEDAGSVKTSRVADYGGPGPFTLPDDHKAGMDVPPGGSSCAKCRFLERRADGVHCSAEGFVAWNGSSRIPTDDPDTYCSDWFMAGESEPAFEQEGEVGADLQMIDGGEGGSAMDDWADSYTNQNQSEGGGSTIHLGQQERPSSRPPWVAVDLDGTLLQHAPGMAEREQYGQPLQGAAQALRELKALGWKISIFTARLGDGPDAEERAARIAEVLESHGIPFDDVWIGRKPRADVFVDDKAIPFKGNWQDVLRQLVETGAQSEEGGSDWHVEDAAGQAAGVAMDQHAMPGYMDGEGASNDFTEQGYTRSNISVQRPPDRREWF